MAAFEVLAMVSAVKMHNAKRANATRRRHRPDV
jgi:hypothetical protein